MILNISNKAELKHLLKRYRNKKSQLTVKERLLSRSARVYSQGRSLEAMRAYAERIELIQWNIMYL